MKRKSAAEEEQQEFESICQAALTVTKDLENQLGEIQFSAISYWPTIYASDCFEKYLKKYGDTCKDVLFLGMNPGPWGMSQTGVPFGEISSVKDWLQIKGVVNKPPKEIADRPVLGFDCHRTEISGLRFWSLMREICKTPETFFLNCIVHNYCPVQFMTASGKNVTPNELKNNERDKLYQICDDSLLKFLRVYKVKVVVCIGKFVETRVNKLLKQFQCSTEYRVVSIPHPSPRSVGNQNWPEKAMKSLEDLNLMQYLKSTSPYF